MRKFLVPDYVYKAKDIQENIYKSEVTDEDVALMERLTYQQPEFYPDSVKTPLTRFEFVKRVSYAHLQGLAAHLPQTEKDRIVSAGEEYFDWKYLNDRMGQGSRRVFVCAGAGINISFEIHLAETFPSATVAVLDPTPQSVEHFENIELPKNLIFLPVGLAGSDTTLKFFKPNTPGAGSLSTLKLNPGDDYFELPVQRVQTVLSELGRTPDDLTFLKFDIEGAEHEVIDDLIATGLLPPQIAFEFDQPVPPWKMEDTLRKLLGCGYEVRALWQLNVLLERTENKFGTAAQIEGVQCA